MTDTKKENTDAKSISDEETEKAAGGENISLNTTFVCYCGFKSTLSELNVRGTSPRCPLCGRLMLRDIKRGDVVG